MLLGEIAAAEISVLTLTALLAAIGRDVDAAAMFTAKVTSKSKATIAAEIFALLCIFSPASVMWGGLF